MINKADPHSTGEWWQNMFDPDWIQVYAHKNRDTRREVSALKQLLGLPPGAEILDVCCGNGRVSLALAQLGYQVTGLDSSACLLAAAAKKAARAGLTVEWLNRDMREINTDYRFDAVINIFTSFGYFVDEKDDLKALQAFQRALKPDGKLVLDMENLFFIARTAQMSGGGPVYRPLDGYHGWVEEKTDFDPVEQRVNMRLRLWLPGKRIEKSGRASYRAYSLLEMKRLLKEAGFTVQGVFGDFGLNPYTLESIRMILLCVKSIPAAP